jgi:hypothetical protein
MVPGCVRQVNGAGVDVGGTGLGVNVAVAAGGGEVNVWAGILSFEGEQAESPVRSGRRINKSVA